MARQSGGRRRQPRQPAADGLPLRPRERATPSPSRPSRLGPGRPGPRRFRPARHPSRSGELVRRHQQAPLHRLRAARRSPGADRTARHLPSAVRAAALGHGGVLAAAGGGAGLRGAVVQGPAQGGHEREGEARPGRTPIEPPKKPAPPAPSESRPEPRPRSSLRSPRRKSPRAATGAGRGPEGADHPVRRRRRLVPPGQPGRPGGRHTGRARTPSGRPTSSAATSGGSSITTRRTTRSPWRRPAPRAASSSEGRHQRGPDLGRAPGEPGVGQAAPAPEVAAGRGGRRPQPASSTRPTTSASPICRTTRVRITWGCTDGPNERQDWKFSEGP